METNAKKRQKRKVVTHYASAERSEKLELYKQIDEISVNPVINELLKIEPGLLAILNSNRQIITVNRSFIESLQIEHASDLLGLRPGEALNCDYSHIMKAGCGTSEYCSTCGAVIAMVVALSENKPAEKNCIITSEIEGKKVDYYFKVKATPFVIDAKKFILLFLQDITMEHQREYLERVFFHDLANIITALDTTTTLIERKPPDEQIKLIKKLRIISDRLNKEVAIHRLLLTRNSEDYHVKFEEIELTELIEEISDIITLHKSVNNKNLEIDNKTDFLKLETDRILLSRVIMNMLINAFEASQPEDRVKLIFENSNGTLKIKVWNNSFIENETALRIFQKNYSTKQGTGRGLGTYSMKLFGEQFLKGTIDFESSRENGTTFTLTIPV